MSTKKKKQQEEAAPAEEKGLEQLMLDQLTGKYPLVPLASIWALELRRREENKHLSQSEILDMALNDLLRGKVPHDEVRARTDEILAATFPPQTRDAAKK